MPNVKPERLIVAIAAISAVLLFVIFLASGKDFYEFLKDFNGFIGTLVTGLGGFYGVIYTLDHNADLARTQQKQNLVQEREAIRKSLLGEISVAHSFVSAALESAKTRPSKVYDHFDAASSFVGAFKSKAYEAALPKIGLLAPKHVHLIVNAYSSLDLLSAIAEDLRNSGEETKEGIDTYFVGLERAGSAVTNALECLRTQ